MAEYPNWFPEGLRNSLEDLERWRPKVSAKVTQPTNLRQAEDPYKSCAVCRHFDYKMGKAMKGEGHCDLFNYDVRGSQTCDSFTPR